MTVKRGLIFLIYPISVACAALLSDLSPTTLNQPWVESLGLVGFMNFMLEYRLWLIVLFAVILVFLPNPQTVISSEKFYREIRLTILEQIRDEVFDGSLEDKRITILSKCGRRKAIWLHLKRTLRWGLMKLKIDKLSNIQLHRGTFLTVKHRLSNEDGSYNSKSAFFCHHSNHNLCEGVAAVVTRSNRTKDITDLPEIENIDIKKTYLNKEEDENYELLNRYMKRTYIKNFRTLLKVNRKAKHFFGLTICGDKGTPVGTLLIDSMEDEFNLTDEQKYKLQIYTSLLGKTF